MPQTRWPLMALSRTTSSRPGDVIYFDVFDVDTKLLFHDCLRIKRPEDRLHQRLGIRLRRRIAWWSSKTTDELFEGGKETIMTEGEFTIPLEVTPEDYAEFTIVE